MMIKMKATLHTIGKPQIVIKIIIILIVVVVVITLIKAKILLLLKEMAKLDMRVEI